MYKKLSFMSIFLLGINSIIGSGIFILPTSAFSAYGIYSLWAILFTLVLTVLFGMCFAEMAGIYDKDGGVYLYAKEIFGNFIGFNIGSLSFFSATMTWSTTAVGFTQILSAFFPIFEHGTVYALFLPPLLIFITAGITLLGIGETAWSNNLITISKLIPLFTFCLIGLFFMKSDNFIPNITNPTPTGLNAFINTVLIFFFAFTGFEMIPLAANTMENPKKNLPKAIITTLVFVGLFYALIILVSIGLLGDKLASVSNPIAEAFATIAGSFGFYFIWVGSLISILGLLLATSFEGPRALSPLAQDKFLHQVFTIESKQSVPFVSVLTMAILAAGISITGTFEVLLKALSFILLIIYLVPACGVLAVRKRKQYSGYRMPLYPITPLITILITLVLILNTTVSEIMYGIYALGISTIIYFIYAKPLQKKRNKKDFNFF